MSTTITNRWHKAIVGLFAFVISARRIDTQGEGGEGEDGPVKGRGAEAVVSTTVATTAMTVGSGGGGGSDGDGGGGTSTNWIITECTAFVL